MGKTTYYQPGVRNLSETEIRQRRAIGRYGFTATILVIAALVLSKATYIFGLIVFIPAWVAAIGYLQAHRKFCVLFGFWGKHSSPDGSRADVTDIEGHEKDVVCARIMSVQAVMIGLLAALIVSVALYFI